MATTIEQLSYNSPDGSNWGQNASEKIAAYGATPVTQRTATIQASSFISVSTNATVGANLAAFLSEVSQTLTGLGLWKGS
jgi:hypothetical protein